MFTMTLSSNFFHLILSPPHLKINVLLDVLFGAGDFPYTTLFRSIDANPKDNLGQRFTEVFPHYISLKKICVSAPSSPLPAPGPPHKWPVSPEMGLCHHRKPRRPRV